jgi:hypothetical protein
VVDYNSLILFLSFVQGGGLISPGAALGYIPSGWVEELHMVHVAHLLRLQIYAGSFETSQWGEMVCCFSQGRHLLGLGSA